MTSHHAFEAALFAQAAQVKRRMDAKMAAVLARHEGWNANEERCALRALEAAPATGPKGQAVDIMAIMRAAVAKRRQVRRGLDPMTATAVE